APSGSSDSFERAGAQPSRAALARSTLTMAHLEEVEAPTPGSNTPTADAAAETHGAEAPPPGAALEVTAFWAGTALAVEQFHPRRKACGQATLGAPTVPHFIAAGREPFATHVLAEVGEDGCLLRLRPGMQAWLKLDGQIRMIEGQGEVWLRRGD